MKDVGPFNPEQREQLVACGLDSHAIEAMELRVARYRECKSQAASLGDRDSRALRREREQLVRAIEKLERLLDELSPENERLGLSEDPLYGVCRRYLRWIAAGMGTIKDRPGSRTDIDLAELDAVTVAHLAQLGFDVAPSDDSDAAMILAIVRTAATGRAPEAGTCRKLLDALRGWSHYYLQNPSAPLKTFL